MFSTALESPRTNAPKPSIWVLRTDRDLSPADREFWKDGCVNLFRSTLLYDSSEEHCFSSQATQEVHLTCSFVSRSSDSSEPAEHLLSQGRVRMDRFYRNLIPLMTLIETLSIEGQCLAEEKKKKKRL